MEFRGLLTLSPGGVLCMKNALSQQHPQALPDRLEGQRSKDLYPPGSELWARELTLPQPGTPGYHLVVFGQLGCFCCLVISDSVRPRGL